MWQPVQYYHTKMQLTKTDLEGRILAGRAQMQKRKTGSGPILEKMQMLKLADELEEAEELEETAERYGTGAQEEAVGRHETELLEQAVSVKETKRKKSGKQKMTEQDAAAETDVKTETEEKTEQEAVPAPTDADVQMLFREQMREHMLWAEILGEPVSVKRRKKRMEQIYGNQGNAYRR